MILLLLTGVGPVFAWRKTSLESLKKAFFWPVIIAAAALAGTLIAGIRSLYPIMTVTLCAFVLTTIIEEFYKGTKIRAKNTGEHVLVAIANLTLKNKRRYGGYIVHFAIVLIFVGLAGNAFNRETVQPVGLGETIAIGDYTLKVVDYHVGDTPNYVYGDVSVQAFKNGMFVSTLTPEKRIYKTGEKQSTTAVAIRSTPAEDLYVVFAGLANDRQKFELNVHLNPLVFWVWLGAVVMFVGTIITLLPDRTGAFTTPYIRIGEVVSIEVEATLRAK